MGAFHEGHLALFRAAREENELVVVSLFVNPAQFGEGEDLGRYPRDEARDAELAEEAGVDVLFVPEPRRDLPARLRDLGRGRAARLDARGRAPAGPLPRRRDGLPEAVQPRPPAARAYFGQKDAQQVAVVKRMVRDLAVPVEIRVVPTVRDADGLALSSRNAYLSPEERERALALPRALAARDRSLLDGLEVDYFEEADFEPRVLAAAVRVGGTRLIDNVVLEGDPS